MCICMVYLIVYVDKVGTPLLLIVALYGEETLKCVLMNPGRGSGRQKRRLRERSVEE